MRKKDHKDLFFLKALQMIAGSSSKAKPKTKTDSDASSGDSTESDIEVDGLARCAKRSFLGIRKIRRRVRRHPKKVYKEWESLVKRELGVVRGQPWNLRDWRKSLPFEQQKALPRFIEMLIEIYMMLAANDPEQARAQCAQSLKCCAQVAYNSGDWRRAWLYTGLTDPCGRLDYAGTEEEACIITSYLDARYSLDAKMAGKYTPQSRPPNISPERDSNPDKGTDKNKHPKGGTKGADKADKGATSVEKG